MLEPLQWWHLPVIFAISSGVVAAFFASLRLPLRRKKEPSAGAEDFTPLVAQEDPLLENAPAPEGPLPTGEKPEEDEAEQQDQEEQMEAQSQRPVEPDALMDVFTTEEVENPILKTLVEDLEDVELEELLSLCRDTLSQLKKCVSCQSG